MPKKIDRHPANPQFASLLTKWTLARQQLAQFKQRESVLRKQVLEALYGDNLPVRGTQVWTWTDLDGMSHETTWNRTLSYKCTDPDTLAIEIAKGGVLGMDDVFRLDYKVAGAKFEALDIDTQVRFEPFIESKPNSPTLNDITVEGGE